MWDNDMCETRNFNQTDRSSERNFNTKTKRRHKQSTRNPIHGGPTKKSPERQVGKTQRQELPQNHDTIFQCPWTHHDWENTSSANTWLVSVTAAIRGDFSSHFGEANLCFLCLSQHDLFTHIWMSSNVWETWRGNIKKEETLFIIPSVTMADGLVKDTSFQGVCPCVCAITCVSQESTYQLIFNRQLGNKGNFSSAASVRSSGTANG